MSMYTGIKTVVKTLSPLLFVIVMEALSREFRVILPWDYYCYTTYTMGVVVCG